MQLRRVGEGYKIMAKRTDKDFKAICRAAAQAGLMNDADGKWMSESKARAEAPAMYQSMMAGYKVGQFAKAKK